MKLSCLPVSLFPQFIDGSFSLSQWMDAAAEIGLDGADISTLFLKNHTPVYLRETREMIESKPIPLVMCACYSDFTHPDPLQRMRELDYAAADAAVCSQLHIPYLRVLAGQAHPGVGAQDGVKTAIENLRALAKRTEAYGVTLVYENHAKPGAWDAIDLTYPPPLFLQVFEGIRGTSIRVNFDIGNATSCGLHPLELLQTVCPLTETIHVSDMATLGTFSPVLIGTGATPLLETFSYLKAQGFDNWLCIEEASQQGLDGICKAVDAVRTLWEKA